MARKLGLPALVLVTVMLVASTSVAGDGKAGSTYLDVFAIGVGAGPSAVAAYTAAPGDMWSLTYNPAGLAGIDRMGLGVSQIEWLADASYSYLGMGMPSGMGGLALGLAYFDMGGVSSVTDMYGTIDPDASAEAYNFGFVGGYGFQFPNLCDLDVGVSGHVIQGSLDEDTATAIGLNVGGLYHLMDRQVHIGLAARNIGTQVEFEDEAYDQTITFAGGVSYTTVKDQIPNVDVMVGVDALMPKDQDAQVALGGEVWLYDVLALRAGYRSGMEQGNLTYGAGFKYSDFQLDYTYADYEDLEATHRISLTMGFGN